MSLTDLISGKDSKKIQKILNAAFPSGRFTAQEIVDFARPRSSPLHSYFEWNDTQAAELWRIQQAQTIIQCVVTMVGDSRVRAFHNVYVKEEERRVYMAMDLARSAPDLWQQVLDRAMHEMIGWKNRYETYKQLEPVIKAIKQMEKKHGKEKTRRKEDRDTGHRIQNGKSNVNRRIAALSK